jgi:hypothetical protein
MAVQLRVTSLVSIMKGAVLHIFIFGKHGNALDNLDAFCLVFHRRESTFMLDRVI